MRYINQNKIRESIIQGNKPLSEFRELCSEDSSLFERTGGNPRKGTDVFRYNGTDIYVTFVEDGSCIIKQDKAVLELPKRKESLIRFILVDGGSEVISVSLGGIGMSFLKG